MKNRLLSTLVAASLGLSWFCHGQVLGETAPVEPVEAEKVALEERQPSSKLKTAAMITAGLVTGVVGTTFGGAMYVISKIDEKTKKIFRAGIDLGVNEGAVEVIDGATYYIHKAADGRIAALAFSQTNPTAQIEDARTPRNLAISSLLLAIGAGVAGRYYGHPLVSGPLAGVLLGVGFIFATVSTARNVDNKNAKSITNLDFVEIARLPWPVSFLLKKVI